MRPLAQLGVIVAELPDLEDMCEDEACLADVISWGTLGTVGELVTTQGSRFGVEAVGSISYGWTDADGVAQRGTAPFEAWVPFGSFGSAAECEGADETDINEMKPFTLTQRPGSYRIPVPVSGTVAPGAMARWRFALDAPKSSNSRFDVVFQLADGREVRSRDVELLFFRPQTFPASVRPFQPRC
jgi:hypothetical protein